MQAGKSVAGLLGLMVVAACGAPASVVPTPLNPVAVQANTMQSYGPGSTMSTDSYLDAAPAVATGEEEMPAEEPAAVEEPAPAPQATATPEPEPEPVDDPVVPIMDSGDDDEEAPPKTGILQKAKTVVGNVINSVKNIFKKKS